MENIHLINLAIKIINKYSKSISKGNHTQGEISKTNNKCHKHMFEAMKSMNEVHSVGFKFGVGFGYKYLIWDFGS